MGGGSGARARVCVGVALETYSNFSALLKSQVVLDGSNLECVEQRDSHPFYSMRVGPLDVVITSI